MKPATFVSVIAAFAATANAGCYSGGEPWGDKATALAAAEQACRESLTGTYGGSGTVNGHRHRCINANNKALNFEIWHVKGGDRNLALAECKDGIQKEVNGCNTGGDTTYTNWRYKGDPNAGNC
ncbi:unnamed protein product [Clonostachys rosea]|uniref:Cyanovirin-N domain-containing protein n=1 Tax=Bionectria ochroleuca TaxID=29856 RepID=A0ABY6UW31_BIOOC|nr:unnamed protein product [Clonostachys rosea]